MKLYALLGLTLSLIISQSAPVAAWTGLRSQVRVLHASPDAPAVDVLANSTGFLSNLSFGYITEYSPVQWGNYNIKVRPEGSTGPDVIDANVRLRPASYTTIAAVGFLGSIQPLVLRDQNLFAPRGQSKVRVVHLSPDAPAVDITTDAGQVLIGNLNFKQAEYIRVPRGTYNLQVRVAGTDTVVQTLSGLELLGGTIYSAFAIGTVEPSDEAEFQVLLTKDFENGDRFHK